MATRDYTTPNPKDNASENIYSDLDLMFTAHPISGDVVAKKDSDAIKRSVRNILLTNDYERPFKPNFGANLRSQLFELSHIGSKEIIAGNIIESLEALEPRIAGVKVKLNTSPNSNEVNLTVFYTIISNQKQSDTSVTVSRVR